MKIAKSRLLAGIVAVMILMNCSAVALAVTQHTEYPKGGTWNWGDRYEGDTKYAYSDYYLVKNVSKNTNGVHKTTVSGKTSSSSGWKKSGEWAKSKVACKWNVQERCYYSAQDKNGNE